MSHVSRLGLCVSTTISTGTSPEVSPESTINPLSRQLGSVLSAATSSSQEDETIVYLPDEERKKINLDSLNYALGVISEGKVQPIPHYLGLAWNTLSCAAKEEHTRNAVEAVSLVLRALAPSQEENLWESVTRRERASLWVSPIRPRPTHHYQCDVT